MMKLYFQKNRGIFSFALLFTLILMSNQIAFSQFVCQPSSSTVAQAGALTASDPTQTGRVFRDGNPSGCAGGAPVQPPIGGTYRYDSYNFTAPAGLTSGCATLIYDFNGCGTNTTQATVYSSYNPATPGANIIGTAGFSTTAAASLSFPVVSGQTFTVVIAEVVADSGCANYSFRIDYSTTCRQAGFDRSNDGRADVTYWRPSDGSWHIINSAGGINRAQFGQSGDITTAGDYTGGGQTDLSVYRPGNNTWYYSLGKQSLAVTSFDGRVFGTSGDIPVPGDYDRDAKTDIALWRPSNGFWYVLRSSNNTLLTQQWGQMGDTPVVGDFDGDRINDFGVVRPNDVSTGGTANRWYILRSNFNYGFITSLPFGVKTDKLVPGDYDGDAKTDIAVWRPSDGMWYYLKSSTFGLAAIQSDSFQFGASGDIPQPADYDGDKKTDYAVYRSGIWYIRNSQANTVASILWGTANDQPATSPYKVQ